MEPQNKKLRVATDALSSPTKGIETPRSNQRRQRSLGAPQFKPSSCEYTTEGGVKVCREVYSCANAEASIERLIDSLDGQRGVVLSSGYQFPGRYARWTLGFSDPPLVIESSGRSFSITALNDRGQVLLAPIEDVIKTLPAVNMVPWRSNVPSV
jgi:anthranilate synthase